jgi:predicted DNA-binding WGR domain protein
MGKQFIFGNYSPISISNNGKRFLKSRFGTEINDFGVGGCCGGGGAVKSIHSGVLCSFKSVPIAFWDVATLNQMVFSRALWNGLSDNKFFKKTMEEGNHFGEASHADRDEVLLKEVACRVNNFWMADKNLVLGNVDILDTPNGRIIYTLASVGKVGISSRGFGELRDRGDGLRDVVPDEYLHVCWDMVAFPAVPGANMTLITGDDALSSVEADVMTDELTNMSIPVNGRGANHSFSGFKVSSKGSYIGSRVSHTAHSGSRLRYMVSRGVLSQSKRLRLSSGVSEGDEYMLRYKSDDGKSNKFIHMTYDGGPTFKARWGRFGSNGTVTEYPAGEWEKYLKSKTAKGYQIE